jgi:hypothetical protein
MLRHICADDYEGQIAVNRVQMVTALTQALIRHVGWDERLRKA